MDLLDDAARRPQPHSRHHGHNPDVIRSGYSQPPPARRDATLSANPTSGFFADPAFRPRQIVLGQYLGIAALVAASLAALLVPRAYVGLTGLLPLAIAS